MEDYKKYSAETLIQNKNLFNLQDSNVLRDING